MDVYAQSLKNTYLYVIKILQEKQFIELGEQYTNVVVVNQSVFKQFQQVIVILYMGNGMEVNHKSKNDIGMEVNQKNKSYIKLNKVTPKYLCNKIPLLNIQYRSS